MDAENVDFHYQGIFSAFFALVRVLSEFCTVQKCNKFLLELVFSK